MADFSVYFPDDFEASDFSGVVLSDREILTATQLIEANVGSSVFLPREFEDVSDEELIRASANVDNSTESAEVEKPVFSDISDDEFMKLPECELNTCSSRFRHPVTTDEMANIVGEKFAKKTIEKSTWAVTLFGQWRADRNVRCLSDSSLVYLNKPFEVMSDDELNYTVPLFLTEVLKKDGTEYPPATLRDLVLSLQKFLEVDGRFVKFLNDDKFRNIRDTLDGLMKQRSRQGLGIKKKQAEVSIKTLGQKLSLFLIVNFDKSLNSINIYSLY